MRDFAHPFVSSTFSFFWFFHSPTAKTRAPVFTQNTLKDAIPRKHVPFAGARNHCLKFQPQVLYVTVEHHAVELI